jgi:predicted enzyme related to lactoylglutathione lyase
MSSPINWVDLTVDDAVAVRDFYVAVAGWRVEPVAMGDYDDYSLCTPDGQPVAGVCHARGANAGLPPQWLIYITVDDLDAAIVSCQEHGGSIVREPASLMGGRMCVLADPAGAVAAYYQAPPE